MNKIFVKTEYMFVNVSQHGRVRGVKDMKKILGAIVSKTGMGAAEAGVKFFNICPGRINMPLPGGRRA